MIGTILGNRYEVFYHLGGGGFGQTYLAEDVEAERQWCVVKHLKPFLSPFYIPNLEKAEQLFDREIEVLRDLGQHNCIPSLLDFFTQAGERYLVQEFIDGRVFSKELDESLYFSEIQILTFLKNFLEILDFVHSHKVIHRDIKPPNIIRRRQDKKLVLIDFGAVKQIVSTEPSKQTATRIATHVYTPREQERGKPKLCSDIYALGVVAIEILIGCQPSIDEDTNEIDWQQHRQVSPELANLINKMVRERPVERYVSANETLQEVKKIIERFSPEVVAKSNREPTPYKFNYADYWCVEANKLRDIYGYCLSAMRLYDKAVEINPNHWKAWFNRGITLRYLRKYKESVQSFDNVIEIYPKSGKAQFQKGLSLSKDGNLLEAFDSFNLAIQINPLYPVAWFRKGVVLHALEKYDQASEAFEEAKKLRPSLGYTNFPQIF